MKRKYQSKILRAIHEDMEGLYKLGILSDEEMREFDEDCLVKEPKPEYTFSSSLAGNNSSSGTKPNVQISAKSPHH